MSGQKKSILGLMVAVASPIGHFMVLAAAVMLLFAQPQAREFFLMGGWPMFAVLGVTVLGLLVYLGLAIWLARSPSAWNWPLIVPPALSVAMGALGTFLGLRMTRGAIGGESVDPFQKWRIFSVGVAESLSPLVLGAMMAGLLLSTAAGIAGGRSLTRVEHKRFGAGPIAAVLASLLLLAGLAVASTFWQPLATTGLIAWLPALAGCAAAVLGGMALSGSMGDQIGHGEAMGDLLVGGLLAIAGVGLAATSASVLAVSDWAQVMGGFDVDPRQMVRTVVQSNEDFRLRLIAGALYCVPVAAAVMCAAAPRLVVLGRGLFRSAGGLSAGLAAGVVLPVLVIAHTLSLKAEVKHMLSDLMPKNVELVHVTSASGTESPSGAELTLDKSGVRRGSSDVAAATELDSPEGCKQLQQRLQAMVGGHGALVVVDASVAYGRIACVASALPSEEARWLVVVDMPDMDLLRAFKARGPKESDMGQNEARLHVAADRWLFKDNPTAAVASSEGPLDKRATWASEQVQRSGARVVIVTAAFELPASQVLPALGLPSDTTVILGAPGSAEE